MEIKKKLGKRIRFLRKVKKLTQEELAERTGLSVTFIGLIERGASIPSVKTCDRIARTLGVSIGEIFRFKKRNQKDEKIESIALRMKAQNIEEIKLIEEIAERIMDYGRGKK